MQTTTNALARKTVQADLIFTSVLCDPILELIGFISYLFVTILNTRIVAIHLPNRSADNLFFFNYLEAHSNLGRFLNTEKPGTFDRETRQMYSASFCASSGSMALASTAMFAAREEEVCTRCIHRAGFTDVGWVSALASKVKASGNRNTKLH